MSDAPGNRCGSLPSAPRRRRRWHQFGLRSLFVFTTLIVGLLVAWRTYVEPYRRQREAIEVIKRLGGTFEASEAVAWQRWLIGDGFQNITQVDLANCDTVYQFFPHVAQLPRLETLIIGGPNVTDEHLRRLGAPALRTLVLDSSWETDEGVAKFQRRCPDVDVYHSDRRAIAALSKAGFEVQSEAAENWGLDSVGPQFNAKATLVRAKGSLPNIDSAMVTLKGCRHLWVLDLRGSSVSDGDLRNLAALHRHLGWLYLTGTRVTDDGLEHLEGLTQLQGLYLGQTKVTGTGLRRLAGMTKLWWLNLSETLVADDGLAHLASLTELKMLWMPLTPATADAVARLQESLPDCTIIRP